MNKNAAILGVVAAGGIMLFVWKKQSAGLKTPLGIPKASGTVGAQGSRPRVDNQQQPWYNGALSFLENKGQQYIKQPSLVQSDMQSVVHSAADVWGVMSGLFGKSGTSQNVDDGYVDAALEDMGTDQAENAWDMPLPAEEVSGSNVMGFQMEDMQASENISTELQNTESDSEGYVDSSNSDGWGSDNSMSA